MAVSIFARKLLFELPRPNWLLWACISVLVSIYCILVPYHHYGYGEAFSDWSTIPYWAKFLERDFSYYSFSFWLSADELGGPLLHCICIPIVIGFLAQCFVMLVRFAFSRVANIKSRQAM
jgi:hypothetical protein